MNPLSHEDLTDKRKYFHSSCKLLLFPDHVNAVQNCQNLIILCYMLKSDQQLSISENNSKYFAAFALF